MGARASDPFCHSNSFKPFLQSLLTHRPRVTLAVNFKTSDSAVVARARKQTPTGSGEMVIPSSGTVVAEHRERALMARGVELQDNRSPVHWQGNQWESASLHRHLYGKAKDVSVR